jgi:hypothetical protein
VNAVACEVALGHEAEDLPIGEEASGVEESVLVQDGQPDRNHDPFGRGGDALEDAESPFLDPAGQEGVFAAVAGDAQLGQAEDAHAAALGLGDARKDVRLVAFPIERRLVQYGGADAKELHGSTVWPRASRTKRVFASWSEGSRPTG